MDANAVVATLRSLGDEDNRRGMARYGINTDSALGISVAELRKLARSLPRDHSLARELWLSGIHEGFRYEQVDQ